MINRISGFFCQLLYILRLMMAETLMGWILTVVPKNSPECEAFCLFMVETYAPLTRKFHPSDAFRGKKSVSGVR